MNEIKSLAVAKVDCKIPAKVRVGLILLKKPKLGNLLKFFRMFFPNRRFYEIEFRLKAFFENRFCKY
ncbi:hypothetical protein A8B75_20025 [Sphingomonadales bacterium EhC05]|nr:hypothetical protein A8B75_20025 [Sphingomonadales bacterium EhC05]